MRPRHREIGCWGARRWRTISFLCYRGRVLRGGFEKRSRERIANFLRARRNAPVWGSWRGRDARTFPSRRQETGERFRALQPVRRERRLLLTRWKKVRRDCVAPRFLLVPSTKANPRIRWNRWKWPIP